MLESHEIDLLKFEKAQEEQLQEELIQEDLFIESIQEGLQNGEDFVETLVGAVDIFDIDKDAVNRLLVKAIQGLKC